MAKAPFSTSASSGPKGPNLGPEQRPDAIHDGAPAGLVFGSDNPTMSVPGGMPMQTGGFTPQSGNPPLPRDPMDGYTKAPTGRRR